MATIVQVGESIEGKKVQGTSRKPIEYKGLAKENGKRFHKFLSRFNTKSTILEELAETDEMIRPEASKSSDDEIICDDALLLSFDKRFSKGLVSNASSTHKASSWSFPKQTNVQITHSHQEILDGINKRLLENKTKDGIEE